MTTSSTIDTRPIKAPGHERAGDVPFARAVLDQIREGLVRFKKDLSVLGGNKPWLHLAGLQSSREALGKNLAELLAPGEVEKLRAAVHSMTSDPTTDPSSPPATEALALTWQALDGRSVDSHTVLVAYREAPAGSGEAEDADDGGWVLNGLVHDLTVENLAAAERRSLRERLRRVQKNESLGILAGGLAHDFNNVLTAMIGLADLADLQLPETSEVRPIVHQIQKTADYAAVLVRNLLAYAGKGRETTETVELSALVQSSTQWVIDSLEPKAELEVSCAAGLPLILGDPDQLSQLVTNLILNAAEAVRLRHSVEPSPTEDRRRGPRVRIETGMTRIDLQELRHALFVRRPEPGSYIFVEVWDNGTGMEPSLVPRIFDPFFTTKPAGRGLGLAAVKGIVDVHGGFLRVETEPDRGTAVRAFLPVPKPEQEESEVSNRPEGGFVPAKEPPKGKILVVDDEEAVRGIAQTTLRMAGYEVELAEDGQEGWEKVSGEPYRYSAVLLDITMPRMTGDEMLARVRQLRPSLPVLLSSGFSSNEAVFSSSKDAYTRFLKKPYRARRLKEEIEKIVALAGDRS